jgi:hypothetical protein
VTIRDLNWFGHGLRAILRRSVLRFPGGAVSRDTGTGGHTCKLRLISEPFSTGPNVVVFGADSLSVAYLFFAIHGQVQTEEYKRHWTSLTKKLVVVPDNDMAARFGREVAPALRLTDVLRKKNRLLRAQRDLLLPRFLSGALVLEDELPPHRHARAAGSKTRG